MIGFDLIGKIFKKGKSNMDNTQIQRKLALMPPTALYFILRDGSTKAITLRPDLFPEKIINNGNFISMKSKLQVSTPYGHKNRYFIPFTDTDILIEDYKNGMIDVYPTNRLLVIEGTSDYTTYEITGVYDMASGIYEDILLTENWDVVDPKLKFKYADSNSLIERKSPVAIDTTPAMKEFFAWIKEKQIDLDR